MANKPPPKSSDRNNGGCAGAIAVQAWAIGMVPSLLWWPDSGIMLIVGGLGVPIVAFFVALFWLERLDDEDQSKVVERRPSRWGEDRWGEARKTEYQEYLRSPKWQATREQALARAGYRCQVCNRSDQLQVHHRTYANLGNELPNDLTVLCDPCHDRFHAGGNMPFTPEW